MITMTEIAKLAHVSQPTVSRVLNGNMNVAPEIRERVLACAKEHDYQINALAKGLQGSRTNLMGVLLTDISNGFFADVAKAIETEARKRGYSIILFNSNYNTESEREYLDVVRRYRVDGVLAVPIRETSMMWREYAEKLDVPVVAVTRSANGLDSVYVDHAEAGGMVAGHLVRRGYENFLFIGKEYDSKYIGFHRKLSELGYGDRAANVVYQDSPQITEALRGALHGRRLGIFAGNDIYGLRILSALRELQVSVPGEAGVIGFDDTMMSRYLNPSLSSVSQPIARMAQKAVSRLVYRIEHPGPCELLDDPLHAELVIRQST
ncbi:MAG: LacI family transcriptional regulator [Oscillospiraceae bacterium]|nr:LacI family transcriptional regulator [Oscillospiraceae bacterium]